MISEPSFIPYNNTPYMSEVRGVHPLSSSPASSAFFNTPSMNSPPLQNNINTNNTNNTNGLLNEEVTTIFVVGFPEDMQEREFQNMFMFSPGFEAASLKWHCKDQDDDSATTINPTLNGKKQMIGFARFRTRLEALEAVEVISGKKVDQEKGFTLKAEMAKKNLHVKRGSIAPTSSTADTTPSSQSPFEPLSLINNNNNNNNNSNNNNSNSSNNNTKKLMFGHHEPFTFSPLPSDLLSPMTDYKSDPFALAAEHQPSTMTPTTPVFNDHVFGFRSYSIDGRNSNNHNHNLNQLGIAPRSSVSSITAFTQRLSIKQPHPITPATNTITTTTTTTIPEDMSLDPFNYLSKSSPMPIERNTHPYFIDDHTINNHFNHPHPHQLHSEFPSLASSQRSNSILMSPPQRSLPITTNNSNNNNNHSLTHNSTTHLNTSTNITNNINNNNNTNNNNNNNNNTTTTTTTTSTTSTNSNNNNNNNNNNGISINNNNNTPSNPADQNPPCNTLYVGNLPPNTNEDELRQLFSKCNGYKRMYFRTKPQGPMCFVEFENVMYASQTMGELQGQTLSNSIKGGIRLSFSKNPLFTKPNKTTSSAFDQQQTNQRTLLSSQLNFDPQL